MMCVQEPACECTETSDQPAVGEVQLAPVWISARCQYVIFVDEIMIQCTYTLQLCEQQFGKSASTFPVTHDVVPVYAEHQEPNGNGVRCRRFQGSEEPSEVLVVVKQPLEEQTGSKTDSAGG